MSRLRAYLCAALFAALPASAQTSPASLPRLTLADFHYQGAFRVPAAAFGISEMNFAQGPMEYYPAHNSIFIVGHTYQQSVAEFAVPALVNSSNIAALNMSGSPLQTFSASILDRTPDHNPQTLNRIGGMRLINGPNGPEMIVNAYQYYDAPGSVTQTTAVFRNADNLASSAVGGFYTFQGGSGHTSGWISPVPAEWQPLVGNTYITGQSSGIPIISRLSVGPSAFAFDPFSIVGNSSVPDPVPTTKLLDFGLDHPLASDLSNTSLTNNLWTHLSRVVYGFIVPGTRTYATLGSSGGHNSGVCYKCTQNNGNLCGGYCSPDAADNYEYYWLWDMNDLIAVKNGQKNSYDVRPYEYGVFPSPIHTDELGGGSFDPASGKLFLTVQFADTLQGQYANPPVVIVYQLNKSSDKTPPSVPQHLQVQ